jgi:hypothetical protein
MAESTLFAVFISYFLTFNKDFLRKRHLPFDRQASMLNMKTILTHIRRLHKGSFYEFRCLCIGIAMYCLISGNFSSTEIFSSPSEDGQFPWEPVQDFASRFGDKNEVFDPDTPLTREINTWLNGKNHTGFNRRMI